VQVAALRYSARGVAFSPRRRLLRAMPPNAQPATAQDRIAALVADIAESADRQAFAALFDHFAPRIKSFYLGSGTNAATAEELVQEVMLQVWRSAAQYDPKVAAVSTWIYSIARNKRIDRFRRERRPEVDLEDPALQPDAPIACDSALEREQSAERLRLAIDELPTDQAVVLREFYFADRSHSAIAAVLGVPLGTVKSRLRLALARLRQRLQDLQ
jgi:RNA polymerase sigma factor (sigma-70 family)